uniref:Putative pre-16S rRNA nuclease n=1 Tax=uncultured Thiotrichaceae bacterium TaxID=298394 RepID=A0A6S6T451_9GAMM|nr:MAG: Putative pre-16S rRNA nuclease [uncultured Thiotrichaceae bacterium]
MTVIGFDFGLNRTGVAIANLLTGMATPTCVLYSKNGQPDWQGIDKLIKEWRPEKLIVGMPSMLDGSDSSMKKTITRFCNALEKHTDLPVETANEQLSSREAEQRLKSARQAGRKRKIRKEEIDQLAAAIILENWMQEQQQE